MSGSKHILRNARPTRLEIPSNSHTPSSSAPSSLSPLIVPAPNSSSSSSATQQQQRLTTELITAMGKPNHQPPAEENGSLFQNETIKSVSVPDGEDSVEINPEHFIELVRLGEGAGGTVTKVKHIGDGRIMAKKKINVDPEPNIHRQILRELQFLRTCHSPNIVAYFGASLEDSNSSIAIYMEYCEGGSLDAIYKNVSKREGRIGEVILGKIGESVKVATNEISSFSGKLVASMAETFLGTSYYMAPERIRGLPYKVSADVWSLGLTIMEVAENKFPFPSVLSPIELITHIANMPAPTLSAECEWSEELQDFLKICLEKNGELRPTPKQMLDHPFIQLSLQRRVNLNLWIKQVWEWDE
ncbi:2020_t:CDS:2 [Funneliformis mosseae]|uniref:2020_t:CDS:1 n=1 Tax=Funneliformis mosseae TaxID=27381 RepID=A0A9N8V677_FUNMO|nr:2020_t:CDS:2 [Funneliformis mosseae]